jgi:hypothetical protein
VSLILKHVSERTAMNWHPRRVRKECVLFCDASLCVLLTVIHDALQVAPCKAGSPPPAG